MYSRINRTNHSRTTGEPKSQDEMFPDTDPPDQPRSPTKTRKSWAEIVHEDIKKVTQEEVDRMAEDFENERKKWSECKNVIRNDYGIRRRYIEQLREMQSKNKKEELKYSIMKIKIKQAKEEGKNQKESDIAKHHWRMKKVARLVLIEMLGQRNKKMIIETKEKPLFDVDFDKLEFITPIGEFALGENVYVQFNRKFNPGTNMKPLDSDQYTLSGVKWVFEIQDQNEVMRASGGKKVTVTLKDAAGRFDEEEVINCLKNFGSVHEIRRVDPKEEESKRFLEEESKESKLKDKELNDLLLLMDDRLEDKKVTATDYEAHMTITENIPNLLPICDIRIITSYRNQPAQCFNCYRMGHFSSYCIEKKVDYGIYSLFANGKWGTNDHSASVENLRLREAVSHKKNIMTEFKKGKEIDDIKARNKSMGQVMQNKIGDVMKKNLVKRPIKKRKQTVEDDRCWDLHKKISRLNQTEPSMLTPTGITFLKLDKDGLKDTEKLKNLKYPLKLCELSLAHVESDEEITEEDIINIIKTWKGFEIDPDRIVVNDLKFPRL